MIPKLCKYSGNEVWEKSKMFWTIVYRLCKESGLKFFQAPKIGDKLSIMNVERVNIPQIMPN